MKLLGILLALCGWVLPMAGLVWTDSLGLRLTLCLLGIAIGITGILGFLNTAYLKQALWKK
jgi:hypothetical protein